MSKAKKTKDDPVFPNDWGDNGMSLRDYYAANAIQSYPPPKDNVWATDESAPIREWAERIWVIADEILKARGDE